MPREFSLSSIYDTDKELGSYMSTTLWRLCVRKRSVQEYRPTTNRGKKSTVLSFINYYDLEDAYMKMGHKKSKSNKHVKFLKLKDFIERLWHGTDDTIERSCSHSTDR